MSKKDLAAGLAYELSSLEAIIQPKPQGRAKTDAWWRSGRDKNGFEEFLDLSFPIIVGRTVRRFKHQSLKRLFGKY